MVAVKIPNPEALGHLLQEISEHINAMSKSDESILATHIKGAACVARDATDPPVSRVLACLVILGFEISTAFFDQQLAEQLQREGTAEP